MSKRGCHGNVKRHGQTNDTSKFPQRMYEQLLKVLAPQRKSSFQNLKKTLWGGRLVRPRVKGFAVWGNFGIQIESQFYHNR